MDSGRQDDEPPHAGTSRTRPPSQRRIQSRAGTLALHLQARCSHRRRGRSRTPRMGQRILLPRRRRQVREHLSAPIRATMLGAQAMNLHGIAIDLGPHSWDNISPNDQRSIRNLLNNTWLLLECGCIQTDRYEARPTRANTRCPNTWGRTADGRLEEFQCQHPEICGCGR